MKMLVKNGIVFAVLSVVVGAANAQSSVTLYGRLDAGIEYVSGLPNNAYSGSTSRWRMESGNWGASLWGMKGVEDLGGGNRALFQVEGSFSTTNGTLGAAGSLWNRWATVGLSNDSYGTLLLGRELAITNGVWDFDPFGQTSWSSASLVRGRNWPQTSNNISWQSPKWSGFDVYGQYSFSNATNWNGNGTTTQGRSNGVQVTYSTSLFQLRGIYDEIRNVSNGMLDDVFNFSRQYFAGANVFLGPFKIQAVYQGSRTSGVTAAAYGTPTTTDQEWGGVTWQATPAAALIAAVYHVNANNGGGNATIYSVGGSYNLSKRTLLDVQIATVRNSKTANFGLDANSAGAGGVGSDGHSQSGFYAGIQHSF